MSQTTSDSARRELLRHTLATLAYRAGKAVRGAPDSFGAFHLAATSRTPVQILAHIGDLLDWALSLAVGKQVWKDSPPLAWTDEVSRFCDGLARLDAQLAAQDPQGASVEQLFQGPIADALTHVGQIAMLRRMFGSPVRGENYLIADVVVGRVGPEQSGPRREFDFQDAPAVGPVSMGFCRPRRGTPALPLKVGILRGDAGDSPDGRLRPKGDTTSERFGSS